MRILLLVSSFNSLTQRVWCRLRDQGHVVGVELAPAYDDPEELTGVVEAAQPDLILCPFLVHRVPEAVWSRWHTVIFHPGPVGDRGPSSLDHAILDGREQWGFTTLSAVEKMDAGPVWATSTFDLPADPLPKTALYNGPVADAALECLDEVLRKVEAGERPAPAEEWPRAVPGTGLLPKLDRTAFRVDWDRPVSEIVRRIAAADGSPGATATISGNEYCLYDAVATDEESGDAPGTVVGHDHTEAIAIACGEGTLWVGRAAALGERRGPKLPAMRVIEERGVHFRSLPRSHAETSYERDGDVGYLTIRSYNGEMYAEQCDRLTTALEKALVEDTRVLVVRGTAQTFSNGIHLRMIDAAADPAAAAWENIRAIDRLCLALASADQLTISAFTANAGAGGVMLGLCADVALARDGVVLNPYYDMTISGSELHTWSLPTRVGEERARRLLEDRLPVSAAHAAETGLVDGVGPARPGEFDAWLRAQAGHYADPARCADLLREREERAGRSRPLSYYQALEHAAVARELFEDRHEPAGRPRVGVSTTPATDTLAKLRF